MEKIAQYFSSLGLNFDSFWMTALIFLCVSLGLSLLGRFVFGKRSVLNNAVSSAVGILFIYALTVVLRSFGAQFDAFIAPLPLVTISGDQILLFQFRGAHYTAICGELLSIIILSFLVNLADGWLPKGKSLFGWFFFRCLTVVIGYALHLVTVGLLAKYLPEGIVLYAPVILLGLLILLLLTGVLKIFVGAALATLNPIIGGLYTFFFATVIGKQITRAVLTAGILSSVILLMQYFGIAAVSIASGILVAYIPLLVILLILWFITYKLL